MPKIFSDQERQMVVSLAKEGHTHTEIAMIMKKQYPQNWGSSYAHRSVARILKEQTDNPTIAPVIVKTLDEMSREERFKYIESRLKGTARFRLAFKSFDPEEREVFIEEYLNIIRSTETLTEAEEQALFASILELILAFQSLNRKEEEEKLRDLSMSGEIPETDPRFRRFVDEKYQKEYDQHMKLYQKGMEQLKMSRQQRLKEVRSQKMTLVDLAEALSSKNAQSEVAEEIEKLSKIKDEELKRLLEEGHLHGIFEDF